MAAMTPGSRRRLAARHAAGLAGVVVLLCACTSLQDEDARDGGSADGGSERSGDGGVNAHPGTDAGAADKDAQAGGACSAGDFASSCPSRPCERASGCEHGACVYEPVRCAAAACTPAACSGAGCEALCTEAGCDSGLYPCGDAVCAGVEKYCDPHPSMRGGVVSYENRCVEPPELACGACKLGRQVCDERADRFVCQDVPLPDALDADALECDSTVIDSAFVYLDPSYGGSDGNGSRTRPFRALADALTAVATRSATGVVIGGAPVFDEPLIMQDGASIYGGFGPAPDFTPDSAARPRWAVGVEHYDSASNSLVAASASAIAHSTVLSHIAIESADAVDRNDGSAGATNIALRVQDAGALVLDDVQLRAGAAGAGVTGADGADASSAQNGGAATSRMPGALPAPCSDPCSLSTQVPHSDSTQCGLGGLHTTGSLNNPPAAGNGGNPDGSVMGGSAGVNDHPSGCTSSHALGGGPGAAGVDGAGGGNGSAGVRGTFTAAGEWQAGAGSDGQPGERGSFGGGGGAGGAYLDDCLNEPRDGGDGGGGGAPGCGGDYGRGGGGGGASIALLARDSTGLQLSRCELAAGRGGAGGRGGDGKVGGSGGAGAGQSVIDALCMSDVPGAQSCETKGGLGGDGGGGGQGGYGGGGSGGDSFAIYCAGGTLDQADTSTSAGEPGSGGASTVDLGGEDGVAVEVSGCS